MHLYRFHFLDAAGGVIHNHSVRLPTEAAAITMGQRMLAHRNQDHALEIWQLNHLVWHQRRERTAVAG